MILSFELPFALVPLLKFTSSKVKMGIYANSIAVKDLFGFLSYCCYVVIHSTQETVLISSEICMAETIYAILMTKKYMIENFTDTS